MLKRISRGNIYEKNPTRTGTTVDMNAIIEPLKDKKGKFLALWDGVFNRKKLEKPNTVAVIYLRKSGVAEPLELQSIKGVFHHNGKEYHERRDCRWILFNKKERLPFIIIWEEGLIPIPTDEYYKERDLEERCATLQESVVKSIRHAEMVKMGDEAGGSKISTKTIIIGLIVLVVLGAILKGGL